MKDKENQSVMIVTFCNVRGEHDHIYYQNESYRARPDYPGDERPDDFDEMREILKKDNIPLYVIPTGHFFTKQYFDWIDPLNAFEDKKGGTLFLLSDVVFSEPEKNVLRPEAIFKNFVGEKFKKRVSEGKIKLLIAMENKLDQIGFTCYNDSNYNTEYMGYSINNTKKVNFLELFYKARAELEKE